jgi:hypothetical protein
MNSTASRATPPSDGAALIVGRVRWTVSCIAVGLSMCCAAVPSPAIASPQGGPGPSAPSEAAALAHVDPSHPDSTRQIVEVATPSGKTMRVPVGGDEYVRRDARVHVEVLPRWIRASWSSTRGYRVPEAGRIAREARSAFLCVLRLEHDVADVTLNLKLVSCWQAIELADAGVEWSTVDSSLRIRWLLGPTSRMKREELLLRLSPQ